MWRNPTTATARFPDALQQRLGHDVHCERVFDLLGEQVHFYQLDSLLRAFVVFRYGIGLDLHRFVAGALDVELESRALVFMIFKEPYVIIFQVFKVLRQLLFEMTRAAGEDRGIDNVDVAIWTSAYFDLDFLGKPCMRLVCLLVL